jgi:hypothetical protein
MLIHQIPIDAAFATVRSAPSGLSQADAASRRLEFGSNRIERLPQTPLAVRFLRQFTHFFFGRRRNRPSPSRRAVSPPSAVNGSGFAVFGSFFASFDQARELLSTRSTETERRGRQC